MPIHLLYSTEEDQADFLRAHPNPPEEAMQRLFRFNEQFKVVPDSARAEYIQSIWQVHAGRAAIDTGGNLARAGLTFSGPMMSGGELDDDDDSDDERKRADGGGEVQLEELDGLDFEHVENDRGEDIDA